MDFTVTTRGGSVIHCKTEEELRLVLRMLKENEDGGGEWVPHLGPNAADVQVVFANFTERLGPDQQEILRILIQQERATDTELRAVINVKTNQALAGALSGISKQATALEINPRDIFGIQTIRRAGKKTKTYSIAADFRKIAQALCWSRLAEK